MRWTSGVGRYIIEWRAKGERLRQAAGTTPAEALEAQERKRFELDVKDSGLGLSGLDKNGESLPLQRAENFLQDIQTFRKPLTHQKYAHVLELFAEHAAPKSDARDNCSRGHKEISRLAQVQGLRPRHHPLHRSRNPPQFL